MHPMPPHPSNIRIQCEEWSRNVVLTIESSSMFHCHGLVVLCGLVLFVIVQVRLSYQLPGSPETLVKFETDLMTTW